MQEIPPVAFDAKWKWWLPPNHSSFGHDVDVLYYWIFWITMITFVLVEGAMIWFCFKYRKNPSRKAVYTHGSHTLEVAWTVIPAVILVALGVFSSSTWAKIKNASDPNYPPSFQTTLKITAKQFAWRITYPGADGKFDTDDDFSKENILNVPYEPVDAQGNVLRDENVRIMLTSQDVIHSFFVPVLRIKQDAVPGYVGNVWFDVQRATSMGPDGHYFTVEENAAHKDDDDEIYEVACAELCGLGHSTMRGRMKAMPRSEWEKWVAAESADVLAMKKAK
jgi:cytochrome c oxidase subunit 2